MKVALIYPEVMEIARLSGDRKEFPPFGPMILGAILEKNGHEVDILKITPDEYSLSLKKYDVIGFSITASVTYETFKNCRFNSDIDEHAQLLIAGGIHTQLFPGLVLRELSLHAVCIGEGESVILDLLAFKAGKKKLEDIPCIQFIDDLGALRLTPNRNSDADFINTVPARHLMPGADVYMSGRFPEKNSLMTHVLFNRGCPFKCKFCAVAERRVQYRSPMSCREELIHLRDQFGIKAFAVVDDNFILNKKSVIEICNHLNGLELKWSALSRVDVIDEEIIKCMSKAGCTEIKFGIESGDENFLNHMGKFTKLHQIENALRLSKKYGISTVALMLHGFPGENAATTKKTITFLGEQAGMIDRISLTRFVPLPGTGVYENPTKYRLRGTHNEQGWNGDWKKYSIHNNNNHWWGDASDFYELNESYNSLLKFIANAWPENN